MAPSWSLSKPQASRTSQMPPPSCRVKVPPHLALIGAWSRPFFWGPIENMGHIGENPIWGLKGFTGQCLPTIQKTPTGKSSVVMLSCTAHYWIKTSTFQKIEKSPVLWFLNNGNVMASNWPIDVPKLSACLSRLLGRGFFRVVFRVFEIFQKSKKSNAHETLCAGKSWRIVCLCIKSCRRPILEGFSIATRIGESES